MSIVRRPLHHLSIDELREALAESWLCQRDHWADFNTDQFAELYYSEIVSVLDTLTYLEIPAKTVTNRPIPG